MTKSLPGRIDNILDPAFLSQSWLEFQILHKTTLVEATGADNGFVVTIFRKEHDVRGLLAVLNSHSIAYGLQQSVGFCRDVLTTYETKITFGEMRPLLFIYSVSLGLVGSNRQTGGRPPQAALAI